MLQDSPLRLPNQCNPTPDLLSCGLPSPKDLQNAKAAGIKTIVNLCGAHETPGEAEFVAQLGLNYANIPVSGPADLTVANASALGEILNDCSNHPVLIHCMSGNRVGALLALKAFHVDNKSPERALQFGLAAGLKALEPEVWRLMTSAAHA
jgi:protein tyrosine phosphatase (PTP) superfamily phosphohydrolase (DUF442 family)